MAGGGMIVVFEGSMGLLQVASSSAQAARTQILGRIVPRGPWV
jgi:hypothetical protein